MSKRYLWTVLTVALCAVAVTAPAFAGVTVFVLHDHPNGVINPPTYGLRLDDLLATGEYTFSFDYVDVSGNAAVTLEYDDVAGTIHIYGRVYGGKDTGSGWGDATQRGWADIDFLYTANVNERDNCAGSPGNDLYVSGMNPGNGGSVTLDGWGGNQTFNFTDKPDGSGCSFVFDNDTDPKGNSTLANDASIWCGNGWLMPVTDGSRDWIFTGEMMSLPAKSASWGKVKSMYR